MRWGEGMGLVSRPEVFDILRAYERARRWRRLKALWAWLRGRLNPFERKTLEDLDAQARARVREELDRIDQVTDSPQEEEASDDDD